MYGSDRSSSNIHTHAYIHTYIHTCIHTYIHTDVWIRSKQLKHTYIHTHTYTYIHTYRCMDQIEAALVNGSGILVDNVGEVSLSLAH